VSGPGLPAPRALTKHQGYEETLGVAGVCAGDLVVKGEQRGALVFKAIVEW
jgi:hypothetical protein